MCGLQARSDGLGHADARNDQPSLFSRLIGMERMVELIDIPGARPNRSIGHPTMEVSEYNITSKIK
jgi:hypothetical protein